MFGPSDAGPAHAGLGRLAAGDRPPQRSIGAPRAGSEFTEQSGSRILQAGADAEQRLKETLAGTPMENIDPLSMLPLGSVKRLKGLQRQIRRRAASNRLPNPRPLEKLGQTEEKVQRGLTNRSNREFIDNIQREFAVEEVRRFRANPIAADHIGTTSSGTRVLRRTPTAGTKEYLATTKDGKDILVKTISKQGGKTLEVVVSGPGAKSLGTAETRRLQRLLVEDNPLAEKFTGLRVTGIRAGSAGLGSTAGQEVSIDIRRRGLGKLKQ